MKGGNLTKNKRNLKHQSLASIEYHGIAGATQECMDAVMRLIQFKDNIEKVKILTNANEHCLLLTNDIGDIIAIKSGFASGYGGKGPNGYSYILQLLEVHGAKIDEYKVRRDLIHRLDSSCLTQSDIDKLELARPIRPSRWHDYISERDWDRESRGKIWREFPHIVPYAIIDHRIFDLAKSFFQNADENLLIGYRRLEDIIRKRTGLDEHGSKLFSRAFLGVESKLIWKGLNSTEQSGRAGLFVAAYQAFRNPRAHKELEYDSQEVLTEFLLLNHLYHLEQKADERIVKE